MTAPVDTPIPEPSQASRLAGRYELGEHLGAGGAADVYRGKDLRLGRPVAVKVFRAGSGTGLKDRFEDEAVVLARLQHPGLVTVFDVGRHDGQAFLVMQLVEGRTLRQRITETTMAVTALIELGTRLAEALGHVHRAGILHRDVKPSNILLDAQNRPYLTDFGISRAIDATASTRDGALVGTAAYLAPEQVTGRRVEQKADIYALGLVLLECLTGRLEYEGSPMESAVARLHRPPRIPRRLPAELRQLLGFMTAIEAADRPDAQTCAAVLSGLQRIGEPASGAMTTGGIQPGSECGTRREGSRSVSRRRRMKLAAAGALVTATALGMTVPTWGSQASTAPGASAVPSTPQKASASAGSGEHKPGNSATKPARSGEPVPAVAVATSATSTEHRAGNSAVTPARMVESVPTVAVAAEVVIRTSATPPSARFPRPEPAGNRGHPHPEKVTRGREENSRSSEHLAKRGPKTEKDTPDKGRSRGQRRR
ncbi:serine/threonine-protein kinase [Streptomyces tropicalis]|uniref:non-specific serine/threonine protein kinase n=1 Tax=Streptomyces tropicalis TaxID=3034234 RepID=A0ABT6A7E0_9ACTN|nr:serine/threonine-protein kinase [Streptomyces tropicalis]MDF3300559.1 protein kinase [Streptomyces tropicalis]